MTTWGPRIEVNGVRRTGCVMNLLKAFTGSTEVTGITDEFYTKWEGTDAIALLADHPYYKATHAGYIYLPGGDKAPDDWDSRHKAVARRRIYDDERW